jgi:hypothetical protein
MPSLDFAYDLVEKLNEEKIDYVLITVRHPNEDEARSDIFYSLQNSESGEPLARSIVKFMHEAIPETLDDEDEDDPPELS